MGKRKESKLHVLLSQVERRSTVHPKWNTFVEHCSPMWYDAFPSGALQSYVVHCNPKWNNPVQSGTLQSYVVHSGTGQPDTSSRPPFPRSDVHHHHQQPYFGNNKISYGGYEDFHFLSYSQEAQGLNPCRNSCMV